MKEVGYDLTTHSAKSLEELPAIEFEAAITMGCSDECPRLRAKVRADWGIPDPKYLGPEEFRQMRDFIGDKVRELLASL